MTGIGHVRANSPRARPHAKTQPTRAWGMTRAPHRERVGLSRKAELDVGRLQDEVAVLRQDLRFYRRHRLRRGSGSGVFVYLTSNAWVRRGSEVERKRDHPETEVDLQHPVLS